MSSGEPISTECMTITLWEKSGTQAQSQVEGACHKPLWTEMTVWPEIAHATKRADVDAIVLMR